MNNNIFKILGLGIDTRERLIRQSKNELCVDYELHHEVVLKYLNNIQTYISFEMILCIIPSEIEYGCWIVIHHRFQSGIINSRKIQDDKFKKNELMALIRKQKIKTFLK